MPTSRIFIKRLGAFRPPDMDDEGAEIMRNIPDGTEVRLSWTRPRNIRFHNKFFAMLGIILKNQEHYKSMDELKQVCKLRIGHVHIVQTPRGEERWPKRMNFQSMDETEFSAFYDRAVDWVLSEVIPGLQRQHLDTEVEAELVEFAT